MPVSLALTQPLLSRSSLQLRLIGLALLVSVSLHAVPAPAAERNGPEQTALRAALEHDNASTDLHAWYAARNFAPAWTNAHGLTANGRVALKTLAQVGNEGLPPARYALPATSVHAPAQLAKLDLAISHALRQYIQDVRYGAANPNAPASSLEALSQASSAPNLGLYLADARPHNPAYARLRGILSSARAKADPASLARVQETILALEKMRWDRSTGHADKGSDVAWLDESRR